MKPFLFHVLLTLLAFAPLCSIAQTDTTYYDQDWNKTEWSYARYYRLTTKINDSNYKVEKYYVYKSKPQSSDYYSNVDSEIRNGHFVSYDEKGFKISEGQYDHNWIIGKWRYYYENSDALWYTCSYNNHGQRTDTLISYYINGKTKRIEVYNDERIAKKTHKATGKCWDENGNEIIFTPFEIMPECSSDINTFLAHNIHYPSDAADKGMQGEVIIKFRINEDGPISDISIVRGVFPSLNEEACVW